MNIRLARRKKIKSDMIHIYEDNEIEICDKTPDEVIEVINFNSNNFIKSNDSQSEDIYFVDKIVGTRFRNDVFEYYISWEGADHSQNSWIPIENFTNINQFGDEMKKFRRNFPSR